MAMGRGGTGSGVRVPLGKSIWIHANDFGENPQNPFMDSVKNNCENPFRPRAILIGMETSSVPMKYSI